MRKILVPILVALTLICLIGTASAVNITAEGNGTIPAWDVSTAVWLQLYSVAAQEISPAGVFFKPDGTKMYVIGYNGIDVNEYDLGVAWDISTAVFLQKVSVAGEEGEPNGIFFKPDGTKMYVIGWVGIDVNEYDLGVAWNVTTAVYLQNVSVAGEEAEPCGVFFKPDGTKMYVTGTAGIEVNEYDLGTPWNISTAVWLQLFDVSGEEARPFGVFFKPDGTKMYVIGATGDEVNEYDLAGGSLAMSTSISGRIMNATIIIGEDASCTQEDTINITNPSAYNFTSVVINYVKPSGAGVLNKSSDSISTLNASESTNRAVSYPWTLPDVVLSETGQGQIIERYAKYTFSLPRALDPDTEVTLSTLKIYLDTSQLPYFHHIEKVTVNGIERTVELENGRYYIYCSPLPAGENEVIVQYHKHDVSHDGGYSPMPDITPPEPRPPAWQWFNEMMQNIREWISQHMRWR